MTTEPTTTPTPSQPPKATARTRIIRHIEAGRLDRAAELVERAPLKPEMRERLALRIARARQDWPKIVALLEKEAARSPEDTKTLGQLAAAHLHLDNWQAASDTAKRALQLDPNDLNAVDAARRAAFSVANVPEAIHYTRELCRLEPDNVRSAVMFIRVLNVTGQVAESLAEYRRLRERSPDDPLVRVFGLRYFAHDPEELRDYLSPVAVDLAKLTPKQRAVATFVQRQIDDVRDLLASSPPDDLLRRPLVQEQAGRDVAAIAVPGAPATVIVFTGFQDQVMGLPISMFDRYLAILGVSAIYLKDFRRLFFLGGVPSLGAGYAETVEGLQRMVAEIGAPRLITLGASGGGLPAIRYGVELGADTAISFSGRSTTEVLVEERQEDPWDALLRNRMHNEGLDPMADLRGFLEAHPRTTHVDVVFGAGMKQDAAHAARIEGLANVSLHPVTDVDTHFVVEHLIEKGEFQALLARLTGIDAGIDPG